jgi:hypothetical protein
VCCGYLTLDEPPGSYGICPICFWEDDDVQLVWPQLGGGANGVSLVVGQQGYMGDGASERRFAGFVRSPRTDDALAPLWRPIDLKKDRVLAAEAAIPTARPSIGSALYYWLPTYWLRKRGQPSLNEQEWLWDLLDAVPELQAIYDEETNFNRELLAHLVSGRISAWAADEYANNANSDPLRRLINFLDRTYEQSSEVIKNVIDVSFIEDISDSELIFHLGGNLDRQARAMYPRYFHR